MELKTRNEMDSNFQWDLTQIYKSREDWTRDYLSVTALLEKIPECAGTIKNSPETLKSGLDIIVEIMRRCERVYLYAFLTKSGDNGDAEYQELQAKAMSLQVELGTQLAFLDPLILSIPPKTLELWLEKKELSIYRHMIENITRLRMHTLDGEKEKLLAMLGDAANTPSDCFEMLSSVDMTFPTIEDEEDKQVTLTHGNFNVYRQSVSQKVRREAFEKYFNEYNKYINTFAAMYAGAVKLDGFFADARGYKTACHASLFKTNVPVDVYDSLTKAVQNGLPTMRKYLEMRKKVLGLKEINMYDLYCPLLPSVSYQVPYEDGKELVKAACAPLGKKYAELLDRAFNERWIDVYENKGKTTGAYSCGFHDVHPYLLLNYTDTLDGAFTLAHELGHAMHSYLSSEKQEYVNHNYELVVAEVASTVNEVLLTLHLLKTETDKKRRAAVLNHFLESFRTTVFRQTLFAEFERKAHDMHKEGVPLTAKNLNNLYRQLNELYYDGAVVNELQEIEWARIPHFYNSFYVYQYATGFCSAVAIAKGIVDSQDPCAYLEFLSAGGSDYPINELKIAGVDLTQPDTVAKALELFGDTVAELQAILEEL